MRKAQTDVGPGLAGVDGFPDGAGLFVSTSKQSAPAGVGEIDADEVVVLCVAEMPKGLASIGGLIHPEAVVNAALPKDLRLFEIIENAGRSIDDPLRTVALPELGPGCAAIGGLPEATFGDTRDDFVLTGNDGKETEVAAFRRHPGQVAGDVDPLSLEPDVGWEADWQKNLTDAALERVKRQVKPMQYQLFDCYVLKGWGVKKTAEVLGINAAQVYLAKHRVGALVKKEVQSLESTML